MRLAVCVLLLSVPVLGCRSEESYPSRPITLICPWSVGGGTDRVSRQMAFFLEHELGVPVNVVNATGGRGVTGHSRGLRARPDGYTLTMMTVELNMLHWQDLTTISWRDAVPLVSVNEDAAALFVRTDAPWRSAADLLRAVEQRPRELTASGTARGGIWHLALAGWLQAAGRAATDIKWIPMGGAGPSLQELASGGLDLVCCSLPEADNLLRQGRVRCLGVMAAERVPGYPDVPTLREQGADWVMVGWRGLAVPKGTPPARVERLVAALERIVTGRTEIGGRTFPQFMAAEKFNNRWRPPGPFRDFLAETDAKFGRLLTSEAFAGFGSRGIGPRTFPTVLLGLMGGLLIALGVRRGVSDRGADPAEPMAADRGGATGLMNAFLTLAAAVAYIGLAESVGFVLTAAGLLLMLLWRFGTRLWLGTAVVAVLVPVVYHVFAHLLRVPLPQGIFGW